MKIAVSASGKSLEDSLNQRLGRCEYFLIYDSNDNSTNVLENTGRLATGAAGIATARLLSDQGVDVIITGNVGPNAFTALQAAGIRVYTSAVEKIKDVLQSYQAGELIEIQAPNVGAHGR